MDPEVRKRIRELSDKIIALRGVQAYRQSEIRRLQIETKAAQEELKLLMDERKGLQDSQQE